MVHVLVRRPHAADVPGLPGAAAEAGVLGDASRAWRALKQLSGRQRSVAWLVIGCDLSIEEASTVLGMRLGTARTHYARAKQSLRASFSEPGDE